jgi:hypothetical protein
MLARIMSVSRGTSLNVFKLEVAGFGSMSGSYFQATVCWTRFLMRV